MKRVTDLFSRLTSRKHSTRVARKEFECLRAEPLVHSQAWPDDMLYTLLDHSARHANVRLLVLDRHTLNYKSAQSMLIGFDPDTREILLDTPSKMTLHTLVDARDAKSEVILQLQVKQNFFNIHTHITDLSLYGGKEAYVTLTTHHCELTPNKRLYPRISFSQPIQPIVNISPDGKPALPFKLMDISRQGAKILFHGRDIRKDLVGTDSRKSTPLLHAEFIFNDHFTLPVRCELIQAKYLRTPGCHNQVRVKFHNPEATAQAQLDELIELLSTERQYAA